MKLAFAILILWGLMTLAHAEQKILVTKLTQTEFEAKFELLGSKSYDRIFLDCHSFIHGVTFYQKTHLKKHFYLEVEECQDLFLQMRDRSEQGMKSCLVLEESPRRVSV